MTKLESFNYELPEELIAQYPADRRDASRLLVIDRANAALVDRQFSDICEYLNAGDVLVMNNSQVIHARLLGKKSTTGAQVELFLLKDVSEAYGQSDTWEALIRPARRLKPGDTVQLGDELLVTVVEKHRDGTAFVSFRHDGNLMDSISRDGSIPLPPYIKRGPEAIDYERYQTVYADKPGSAAAPTAGLHFTEELLTQLHAQGVKTEFVTLHVGLGTFRPVKVENIEEHRMHEEFYHIESTTADAIQCAKAEGRRVICVGTTSVRTLESAASLDEFGTVAVKPGWGSTRLFIYPGSQGFKITDALITNFHLPKSSLIMLVSAFYDRGKILEAYRHAISQRYRFFSYGDAMLIL